MDCPRDQMFMLRTQWTEKEVLGKFLRTREVTHYECLTCGVMVHVIFPYLYRLRSIK